MTHAVRALILAAAIVTAAYAALGVAAALALSGIARTIEVARLRTLGLTGRQSVGLAVAEHGPTTVAGFVLGGLLGVALFALLRSALGLAGLVGSPVDVPIVLQPGPLLLIFIGMIAVVAVGLGLGAALQRRVAPNCGPTRKVRMTHDAVPSPAPAQTEIEDLPDPAPRRSCGAPAAAVPGAVDAGPCRAIRRRRGHRVRRPRPDLQGRRSSRSSRSRASTCSSTRGEMIAIVGASGSGKSHAAQHPRRDGRPVRRAGGRRRLRPRPARQRGADALPAPGHRVRLAADRPEPAAVPQRRENVELPMILDGPEGSAGARARAARPASGSSTARPTGPTTSRAGSSSASRSRSRWPTTQSLLADEPTGELDSQTSATSSACCDGSTASSARPS